MDVLKTAFGVDDQATATAMPRGKPTSLKGHRFKRGLEKLQPKWKNPAAGKALYLFGAGAVSMAFSLLAPFWYGT